MRFLSRGKLIVIALVILFVFSLFQSFDQKQGAPSILPQSKHEARVVKVIDGDTIRLETGEALRYIGIDTPESVDLRRPDECFGQEASERNKQFVLGKIVRLEKDVSETDRFGRLLRYVYVGETMINEQLVREGFAHASSYPPDVKYQERFRGAERLAREEGKGLWSGCAL